MAVSGSWLTNSYRTHVLNDFSVVMKAVFYALEFDGKEYTLKDKLPVQINPDNLDLIRNSSVKRSRGIINNLLSAKRGDNDDTLRVELYYNIYDEYNVRTNYGMDGALDDSVSLANKDFTSLPKLQSYANKSNMYVLFRWGDINFFGQIENVSCTYDAFSQWGNPLSCRAMVSVKACDIKGNTKDEIGLDCFSVESGIGAAIKEDETTTKVLQSIAIIGMDITNDVVGIALDGIQGALR